MTEHAFSLAGAALVALPTGALWWPEAGALAVSDLHLGKSGRIARLGGALLPPYEVADTLARLAADIARLGPRMVICLGDSFDDPAAADLDEANRLWLARLMAGRRWIWVEGNHDPGPVAPGGEPCAELTVAGLTFRHIARGDTAPGEVSGHYHPKARLAGQSRPCFLRDDTRLILPAYGSYTGGLTSLDPALAALMQPGARAILTGRACLEVPMPRRRS